MDFFNQKELVTQTGHAVHEWPFVITKELFDNALDACEDAGIAPVIEVAADAAGITVSDNGPGLPEATLRGVLDFTTRVSDKEAYVAPCRGAQGNAIMTLIPMPGVCDPEGGRYVVEAHGKGHVITCGCDAISQRAVVHDDVTDARRTKGTRVRLQWTPREGDEGPVWPFDDLQPLLSEEEWDCDECGHVPCFAERFRALVEGYALFNPHLTIKLNWFGEKTTWQATDPGWRKWKPSDPTSCHWYEPRHLERLIGAYITHDREAGTDRLVSDFVAEFDGLSGSAKRTRVLGQAGLKRAKLSHLVAGDRLDTDRITGLLRAMQANSRPVKSDRLGVVGEDHFRRRLLDMGVVPESFRYSRKLARVTNAQPAGGANPLPWVLESAFGWLGPEAEDQRRIYTGANWSSAINNPFRAFGPTGEGLETVLAKMRATRDEPVVFVLHLAHPRIEYTDRGKSALVVGG
jgi:hypothetical protein